MKNKKNYVKPITEVLKCEFGRTLLSNSDTEPEVTENIGAKENTFDFEDEVDDFWGNDN